MKYGLIAITALVLSGCAATGETTPPPEGNLSNDMLTSPQGNLSNDMLPSAEVSAFQRTDARLGYANARIGRDFNDCATYQATGPNGRPYNELLRNEGGEPICAS